MFITEDIEGTIKEECYNSRREVNILQDFNSGTKELIKREIRKQKQLPISKSYKPNI